MCSACSIKISNICSPIFPSAKHVNISHHHRYRERHTQTRWERKTTWPEYHYPKHQLTCWVVAALYSPDLLSSWSSQAGSRARQCEEMDLVQCRSKLQKSFPPRPRPSAAVGTEPEKAYSVAPRTLGQSVDALLHYRRASDCYKYESAQDGSPTLCCNRNQYDALHRFLAALLDVRRRDVRAFFRGLGCTAAAENWVVCYISPVLLTEIAAFGTAVHV
jgi:hypothetical protein